MSQRAKAEDTENGLQARLFGHDSNDDLLSSLASYFGLTKEQIESPSRKQDLVEARQTIMYLLREYGGMSFPAIARLIGNRDHTTIIHGYNKMRDVVMSDPALLNSLSDPIKLSSALKLRKEHVANELKEINAKLYAEALNNIKVAGGLKRPPRVRTIPQRDIKILEMYREGLTLQNIAEVFKVSRERVRQIVTTTIQHLAVNESITKGIVMDIDVLIEEESKTRQSAKNAKKPIKVAPKQKEVRWSQYYEVCITCGKTTYPHVRKGNCEQCLGSYRGKRREQIIIEHSSKCDACKIFRPDAIREHGRDFYITKDRSVLCRKCFLESNAKKLGHYKHHEWSRFYPACIKCGTTEVAHSQKGLCQNCAPKITSEHRESIITAHGNKCEGCGLSRPLAKEKFKTDLRLTRENKTLCLSCFIKYTQSKRRNRGLSQGRL